MNSNQTSLIIFLGLSAPHDVRLLQCRNKVRVSWHDIKEKKNGYCISHRSLHDHFWTSCCRQSWLITNYTGGINSDDYAPRIYRFPDNSMLFEQKLMDKQTLENAGRGSCQIPVQGYYEFKVAAYNQFGTGYAASTKYHKCYIESR